ncbi:MAG: (2Fe-2S)-binding protein [Chitinophagaceae bacterium]|nr:(2Fe-2S)-binding protein [Rubrivivax sp.]
MTSFLLNGQTRRVDDPDLPLLLAVREVAGLTGTKYGCGKGLCGACTLHVDGRAMRSCTVPVSAVSGKSVTTIEGLSPDRSHPVQRAWLALDVPQCGYCQSGMIMAVSALLQATPKPTDAQIDSAITNICRCATYHRVRQAIHRAAGAAAAGAKA